MRVVHTVEGALLGLLALGAASLLSGEADTGKDAGWERLPPRAALAAAPCPEPDSADLGKVRPAELAAARGGRFAVFGAKPTRLRPPIAWTDDPLDAHRYRQNLHKLRYLRPLLASYRDSGDTGDLVRAFAIALDWVEQNPRGNPETPSEAWGDKISGDRVPFLSYLLRAAACEEVGSWKERRSLLAALEEHGRVLAADRRYAPNNHGLFVDLGLVRLARMLPFSPHAESWRELGRRRFAATLTRRLSDGYWLEHSTGYQFLAIRAVERLLTELSDDPELEPLLAEMRDAAGWMVRPDGEMTQFGESHREAVPEWVDTSPKGLRFASEAGLAFVRADGDDGVPGYLAVTSSFHNLTHKQADELSFELFDGGEEIVTDTGSYDKDPGPLRDFVVSNRAHSTLVADGFDLPVNDRELAYGSGLTAAGEGDGWFAIAGRNRLLERVQDVSHRRLFLYRPGSALVIVDRVRSSAPRTYTRYLHFGPEIRLRPDPSGAGGRLEPLGALVREGPSTARVEMAEVRGQRDPLQGFTSPAFRRLIPRSVAELSASGEGEETLVLTIAIDPASPAVDEVSHSVGATTVTFDDGTAVTAERDGERLAVAE